MPQRRPCVVISHVFVAIFLTACGESPQSDAPVPDPDAGAMELPLLPPGNHLGIWPTYEVLPVGTAAAADARWSEARSAGMAVARVHVSWAELEPAPGSFDLEALQRGLEASDGLAFHLLIETIDSDGYTVPPDLADPANPYALAGGITFDDPVVTARFAALLDQVLPALDGRPVFAFSVGNEPDNYLDDVAPSSTEGLQWVDALAGFLAAARQKIHATRPEIAVAITLRQGSWAKGITTLGPVIEAGDALVFNYYCQDLDFQVQPATVIEAELDEVIASAGGRPLIIQELGCPAGTASSSINASATAQADFFREVGRIMMVRPSLRAAFGFQLVDWSPELTAIIAQVLRDEGYDELADMFAETLSTIGLLRYGDGTARPGWSAFLEALQSLE